MRLATFAGQLLATPGKICCLKRDGIVSHSVGRHGGDTWRGHIVWSEWTREFEWLQVFPLFFLYLLPCPSLCECVYSYPPLLPPSPDPVLPIQASKAWRKNKMDESKHEIHSQVDAITAGTASVVNLTAGIWRVGIEGCPSSGKCLISLV